MLICQSFVVRLFTLYSNLIAPYVSCKVYMTVSFSFNDNIGVLVKNFLIIVEVFVSFDAFIVL